MIADYLFVDSDDIEHEKRKINILNEIINQTNLSFEFDELLYKKEILVNESLKEKKLK